MNRDDKDQEIHVIVSSDKKLELNLSQTLIETMLNAASRWRAAKPRMGIREVDSPYIIKNETGYPIVVWDDFKQSEMQEIAVGGSQNWRFEDWRTMREVCIS